MAATKATVNPVAKVRILAADENVLTQPEAPVQNGEERKNDMVPPKLNHENNPLRVTKLAKGILQIKVPEEEASELH